eukprot:CFRG6473T1
MDFQLFVVLYGVLAACLIFPPPAFISMEFTVKGCFRGYIGEVENKFIDSELRRTSITIAAHSIILALFFAGCEYYATYDGIDVPVSVRMGCIAIYLVCLAVVGRIWYWTRSEFRGHPAMIALRAQFTEDVRTLIDAINTECVHSDTLRTGIGEQVLLVTENWVVVSNMYSIKIVRQQDIDMSIVDGQDVPSMESGATQQILTIQVTNIHSSVEDFKLRLNSVEYGLVQAKLHTTIRNVAQVVIKQSVSERVMDEFLMIIAENSAAYLSRPDNPLARLQVQPQFLPTNLQSNHASNSHSVTLPNPADISDSYEDYHLDDVMCAGCMNERACIILAKNCGNDDEIQERFTGEASTSINTCKQCVCTTCMWCVRCVIKWFTSRQNQSHPEGWFGGKAPCPTCRSVFCVFDVVDLTEALVSHV